jgi:hypothetical protein
LPEKGKESVNNSAERRCDSRFLKECARAVAAPALWHCEFDLRRDVMAWIFAFALAGF